MHLAALVLLPAMILVAHVLVVDVSQVPASVSTLLITIAVGTVIPFLVELVTKEPIPAKVKAYVLTFLSIASGVLIGLLVTPPTSVAQWEQVLVAIFVTFVTAVVANHGLWEPTGATPAVSSATAGFGIGPAQPKDDELEGAEA